MLVVVSGSVSTLLLLVNGRSPHSWACCSCSWATVCDLSSLKALRRAVGSVCSICCFLLLLLLLLSFSFYHIVLRGWESQVQNSLHVMTEPEHISGFVCNVFFMNGEGSLAMESLVASNSLSSYLNIPHIGIIGARHHTQPQGFSLNSSEPEIFPDGSCESEV